MSRHESTQRFYERRAAEEAARAKKSVTLSARNWHEKLARDFALRAKEPEQFNLAKSQRRGR